ncbi:hypothetical protein LUZ63_013630 [Rhynchospora breviuscula]|uniref:non-specific serine/threonine protein kinase n=1 Tax=Rhynchospora breviuscula TaxID=2022672 RepID=A0A9Q0HL45_9POAL|nr:hypothetical protein LUZ63_013630 [Rhynchospora breviuscula]
MYTTNSIPICFLYITNNQNRNFLKMKVSWCFLVISAICAAIIEGQASMQGFISIDCGAPSGTRYQDNSTGIFYVSDDSYIDTGTNYRIDPKYTSPSNQASTLRSFPNETRNCYTLNVTEGAKYLVRATFLYGNYDRKKMAQTGTPLQFDLYIDTSLWLRVNVTDASNEYAHEVITVATNDWIWVCLVDTNAGTPFISALELRPLNRNLYGYASSYRSYAILFRLNYGPTESVTIRYPDDQYDRIWAWYQYDTTILKSINTKENITLNWVDSFQVPNSVLQTALTPVSSQNLTTVSYDDPSNNLNFRAYYAILHMTELQELSENQSRQYDIYLNDEISEPAFMPKYCKADHRYVYGYETSSHNVITLVKLHNSTLPPILNGMEVYWPITMEINQVTTASDVRGIMAVKADYQIIRNWNGDPCSPNFSWHGVSCNGDKPPQITSLNLSYSGLSGEISDFFAKLKSITNLDLSHNNLSGDIPELLAGMSTLQVLNLSGNHLNGHVPEILLKRNSTGLLFLLVDCYANCEANSNKSSMVFIKRINKSSIVIIVISAAVAAVVTVIVGLFLLLIFGRRRRRKGNVEQESQIHSEVKQFNHEELKDITNNFSRTIGSGGFGIVYHGYLKNQTEVAVKACTLESTQANKQFLAEVRSLSLVHHRNLVRLVGYCKDGVYLAVVYEYLPRGSLFDHLKGKDSSSTLNWRMRLNILLEAAQALDYLHTGCGMVHRDVKSSNILLGQNFEAKVSDLGLARMFSADVNSIMTLSGTPGYIDPEYQLTFTLNEKSDVYSFGVILMEVVTGERPILMGRESIHIVNLVREKLAQGGLDDVVDSRLEGAYDSDSVWKFVELAMMCTRDESANRPTMADVVVHLKDCLQIEEQRQRGKQEASEKSDMNTCSISTPHSVSVSFASDSR